ncbi:MAG: phosphoenolpyruvate synthase [Candidatus Thioglobus sp.]|uniref:phosphoenolpyruvate synthase n=1 Tax=Candidatus Thioglobus sp. TaxID=2026721 RepID=UPI002631399E|nr:phosphoenolpyruvate synthase [Candidatus Thioglobus sp.]MDC9726350.1 phosphoenolpyruvate synthase [Candidatus Thioglobus sp.]
MHYTVWLKNVGIKDVETVGGKNASLGQMISALSSKGVQVPGGFATTANAFEEFLKHNNLKSKINLLLEDLDPSQIQALTRVGATIRNWVQESNFPDKLLNEITHSYQQLELELGKEVTFAVRSSATAEDLPEASFAGQQETYLNVHGIENILSAIKKVFASLYNDRAISYRVHQGFEHSEVSLSAGIQQMIRSDIGASGVMFTLDTESGFNDVVFITSAYGLGETVVQGSVNPDEFYVHKPGLVADKKAILSRNIGSKEIKMVYAYDDLKSCVAIETVPKDQQQSFSLNDNQVEELARYAIIIEQHYARPMDIEWALDGSNNKIYIVQARPETVKSRDNSTGKIDRYQLHKTGKVLIEGRSIGQKIGTGVARIINNISEMDQVQEGDILVTDMTDPDWEPVMKRASAIVTNRGGRTCHAAIIARELGVPAIVGTIDATKKLTNHMPVTASCAQGDTGYVYEGILDYEHTQLSIDTLPEIPVKIMMNVGNPGRAFDFASIPNSGVGLARLEFIINTTIGIHPKALLEFDQLPSQLKAEIKKRSAGYKSPIDFYIDKLTEGIATIAAAFADSPVIIRMSDFKSNEYANLLAGDRYEPKEENPMIGFRGAARYISKDFKACFELECQAIKKVREEIGLTNIEIMIPFVRTTDEAKQVIQLLKENQLERGVNGLRIIMMCELPSNALLAEEFLQYFDGFSIGSNDMTQLTLGMDRDSGLIADGFDERNPAVKKMISMAIDACHKHNKYIGICGQGPSDHPDLAQWLLDQKISSISLNPDTVVETWASLGND